MSEDNTQIRILMILKNYFGIFYGTQSQALSLAEEFKKAGCKVEFVVSRFKNEKKIKYTEIGSGIPVHILSSLSIRGLGTLLYLIKLTIFLILNKKKYDVYHVFFAKYDAFVVGLLKFLHGKVAVCKTEGGGKYGDMKCLTAKDNYPGLDKIRFPKIILWGLYKLDSIIALSSEIKKEILEAGFDEQKIDLIPNAVDTAKFHPKENLITPHIEQQDHNAVPVKILYVGRFSVQKGIKYLFEAIPLIDSSVNYHFYLAGEGELQDELKEYAQKYNFLERTTFCGYRNEIENFYREHDIFVLPSESEGLSCSLLEAMASGLAVIATRVSGSEDVINNMENGILVEPQNPKALADAISLLIKNEAIRKKMSINARKTILENYTFEIICKKYIKLYQKLLS